MKNIFTFLFFLLGIMLYSQQSTFTKSFDWAEDMVPMNMLIYEDYLYIPVLVYNDGELGKSVIYKINMDGIVIDSTELIQGLYNWIFEILPNNNGEIFAFGSSWEGQFGPVNDMLYTLDESLNLLNTHQNSTSYSGFNRMHGFIDKNNDLLLIGDLSTQPDNPQLFTNDIRLMKFNNNGLKIFDTLYARPDGQSVYSADYSSYSNTLHLYTFINFDPNSTSEMQYNILDSNYAITYSSSLSPSTAFLSYSSIKIIDENSLFFASDASVFEQPNNFYESYGIFKFDYYSNKEDSVIINYNNDTTCRVAFYNCLDYSSLNELYLLANKNYSFNNHSYIELIKLDSNLNVLWRRFYGGDKNYFSNEVKALEEGGCIISSVFKDEQGDRKTIIMKLDEDGLFTSTNEQQSIPIKNAIITPNPGKDYLQLHTGIFPTTLQMFDINGKMILEENINSESTIIKTQSHSAGTYIWQLVKDGQVVENDKWLKE